MYLWSVALFVVMHGEQEAFYKLTWIFLIKVFENI